MSRRGEGAFKVKRLGHEKGPRNDRGASRKDQIPNYCLLHNVPAVARLSNRDDRNLALFKSSEFFFIVIFQN